MKARDPLEVYVSETGHICIKQEHAYDEPAVVALEPGQALTAMRWIQDSHGEALVLAETLEVDDVTPQFLRLPDGGVMLWESSPREFERYGYEHLERLKVRAKPRRG